MSRSEGLAASVTLLSAKVSFLEPFLTSVPQEVLEGLLQQSLTRVGLIIGFHNPSLPFLVWPNGNAHIPLVTTAISIWVLQHRFCDLVRLLTVKNEFSFLLHCWFSCFRL